jgi:CheY-like chemotaxis protein/ribosomal protein S27E
MKCPRCNNPMNVPPDPQGFLTCPSCGVRLRVPAHPVATVTPTDLQNVIAEIRALQRMQGEILQYQAQILALLKAAPAAPPLAATPATEAEPALDQEPEEGGIEATTPLIPRVRQRRKTVLIVDDDAETLRQAVAAMESAQIPTRTVSDGNAALQAISAQKPDVLVLELGIGEPMPGKDFVNYVKATMEWIEIPIVLHTRLPVKSQQEARTQHGADEVVVKGPGSPEALLNRVIRLFQNR